MYTIHKVQILHCTVSKDNMSTVHSTEKNEAKISENSPMTSFSGSNEEPRYQGPANIPIDSIANTNDSITPRLYSTI